MVRRIPSTTNPLFGRPQWSYALEQRIYKRQGISLEGIRDIYNKIESSKKQSETRLFLVVEDISDKVTKGRTIKLIDDDQDIWIGKVAYHKGNVEFRRHQVKEKKREEWTVEDVCEYVVKPEVVNNQEFYLDNVKKKYIGPQGKGYFVSQWRGTCFKTLLEMLEYHFIGQEYSTIYIWLDLFCANQALLTFGDEIGHIKQQEREDVLSFGLHNIIDTFDGGCLLALDTWKSATAITRAWCIWELAGAVQSGNGFTVVIPPMERDVLLNDVRQDEHIVIKRLVSVDVTQAKCSKEEDQKMILRFAANHVDEINNSVRVGFRKWVIETAKKGNVTKKRFSVRNSLSGLFRTRRRESLVEGATDCAWQAKLLEDNGQYDKAEPLYRRALEIREKVHGEDHPEVATSLNNLAELLRKQSKYDEAEPLYRRALEIREKVYGKDHPDVAQSLNNLAGLLYAQSKYDEAEPIFRCVLEIREKVYGQEHYDVAASLNNLGEILRIQSKYDEAEPLFRRASEIHEKVYGKDHPSVATSLNNLASLLDTQSKYDEAEPLYRCALEIREKVYGKDHPDVANTLWNYGALLRNTNREKESQEYIKRAYSVYVNTLGKDHPHTQSCKRWL